MGHAGTLDPLASGVLVVCVGAATRLIEYVQRMPKTYRTVVRLGARSDTDDAEGEVVVADSPRVPSPVELRAAAGDLVGTIAQRPPEFSAIKVAGRRSYDLARAGKAVELQARPVTVYRLDVLSYDWPRAELEVECAGGTYIRSLARDLGDALGCGGLVEVLVRTGIGPFTLDNAIDLESLDPARLAASLRPPVDALGAMPQVAISADEVRAILQGRPIEPVSLSDESVPAGEVALIGPDDRLVAIAEYARSTGRASPRRVLIDG